MLSGKLVQTIEEQVKLEAAGVASFVFESMPTLAYQLPLPATDSQINFGSFGLHFAVDLIDCKVRDCRNRFPWLILASIDRLMAHHAGGAAPINCVPGDLPRVARGRNRGHGPEIHSGMRPKKQVVHGDRVDGRPFYRRQ